MTEPAISIACQSPGLDASGFDVIVTLPTFRRPGQLLETLRSLKNQETALRFAVIVMDNDAERREGATAALPVFQSSEMQGLVILAHQRGNCFAYNAGWETAMSRFSDFSHIAVIDDDEIASPGWLASLAATAERYHADIVGGPQIPVFPEGADARWRDHPVFLPPYEATGPVQALYSSGNLLIARDVLARMPKPYLDPQFNFIGGGDSDFLSRCKISGMRLAWCAEAEIHEAVPERRLEADWVRARAQRNGMISTLVEQRKRANEPLGRIRVLSKSLALLAAAPLRSLVRLGQAQSMSIASYPLHVAIGRVMGELGMFHEQYRQPEKN